MPVQNLASSAASPGLGGWWPRWGVMALAYLAAGSLGLTVPTIQGNVTLVWPAAGLALAAVLWFGPRLWPGVALGAFLTTFATGAPLLFALMTASGNTLMALAARQVLMRPPRLDLGLSSPGGVLRLTLLGAGLAPVISATVGSLSLVAAGMADWNQAAGAWLVWWVGDAMGILLVTPALLAWLGGSARRQGARHPVESILLGLVLVAVCWVVYGGYLGGDSAQALSYAVFPCLIWAALRLGPAGAAGAVLVSSAVAVLAVIQGRGPFFSQDVILSLFYLHGFLAITAVTTLLLAASVAARRRAEEELKRHKAQLEYRVSLRTSELRHLNTRLEAEMYDKLAAVEERIQREKLQAAVETAGATAHELTQPLTVIQGIAEMWRDEPPQADDGTGRDLESLLAATERMTRIIRRLTRITAYRSRAYVGQSRILDLEESSRSDWTEGSPLSPEEKH